MDESEGERPFLQVVEQSPPWVKLTESWLHCEACDTNRKLRMPMDMNLFLDICNKFTVQHRECSPSMAIKRIRQTQEYNSEPVRISMAVPEDFLRAWVAAFPLYFPNWRTSPRAAFGGLLTFNLVAAGGDCIDVYISAKSDAQREEILALRGALSLAVGEAEKQNLEWTRRGYTTPFITPGSMIDNWRALVKGVYPVPKVNAKQAGNVCVTCNGAGRIEVGEVGPPEYQSCPDCKLGF